MSRSLVNVESQYWAIYAAASRGLSNKEIAQELQINYQTLMRWLGKDGELREMIASLREIPARLCEAALLKKAVGCEEQDVTEVYEVVDGDLMLVKRTVQKKTVAPDTAALKYFLNNRGKDWTDKVQVDTQQAINISFDPALAKV